MVSDSRRPAPPKRHATGIALAVLAVLLLLFIALAGWLLATESGARRAFSALASATGGMLRAEGIHGRLGGPLQIDKLTMQQQNRRIVLDHVGLDWHPLALTGSQIDIDAITASHLRIVLQGPSEPSPPPALPDKLGLPLSLHIDHVRVDSGEIERDGTRLLHFSPLAFALDFDHHRYHVRLQDLRVDASTANGSVASDFGGQVNVSASKPYALHGSVNTRTHAVLNQQQIAVVGDLGLSGSLADLTLAPDFTINQAVLTGRATLHPFSSDLMGAAQLAAKGLDLAQFGTTLPRTAIELNLVSAADGTGRLDFKNPAAGRYDAHKLPLYALELAFQRHGGALDLRHIVASLGATDMQAGKIDGQGSYRDQTLRLALHAVDVNLKGLHSKASSTSLSGDIGLRNTAAGQEFTVALQEPLDKGRRIALDAHATLADSVLALDRLTVRTGSGRLDASAQLALNNDGRFRAQGNFDHFRLHELGDFPQLPSVDLNGKFTLHGTRMPQAQADLAFDIRNSRLAGQPLTGNGAVQLRPDHLTVQKFLLASGANRLSIDGQLTQGDKQLNTQLKFELQAPRLAQLGSDFSGALHASGVVRGGLQQPNIHVEWHADHAHLPQQLQLDAMHGTADVALDRKQPLLLQSVDADIAAQGLRHGSDQVRTASLQLHFRPAPDAPLSLTLHAQNLNAGALRAIRVTIAAHGSTARHDIDATLDETGQSWALTAHGGLSDLKQAPSWQGGIGRFDARGRFDAHLAGPAPLLLSARRTQLTGFELDAKSGRLTVEDFTRDANGISTRGSIERLQVAQLLRQFEKAPPLRTDLQLGGTWNLQIGKELNGELRLQRSGGDVTVLGSAPVTLGLQTLSASATAAAGRVELHLQIDGSQLGRIALNASTRLGNAGNRLAAAAGAPLSGAIHIDVPSLGWVAPLASPGMITAGSLKSDVTIAGTVGTPNVQGQIDGSDLRLTFANLGLDLQHGTLQGEFHNDQLLLRKLSFRSAKGQLAWSGPIRLHDGALDAELAMTADHYQLLDRVDRKLMLSGSSKVVLQDKRASASGNFTVDSGFVDIGEADTPRLSSDVVVMGEKQKAPPNLALALDITVGLGDGVRITGRGVDGTLVGKVRLQNDMGQPLQAFGELSLAKGTFSAYGRELKIEQGEVRFNGPLDNPSLTLLAMRRGQDVEAGVAVRGSVLSPQITLVSQPEVPDAEKLSWLVLGHNLSSATSSDAGALQDAAGSLLSRGAASALQSRIASALGLDTLSVGTSQDSLQQRIVTLGKQISSRLYLSYQQGLQSAGSVVRLRYLLTPKLTVEAEAGARSALSLFYNITFN